ncbi:AdoMet-homocysteine methyltransferase [Tilletia horrida]|uniref:AdoMet-homocysteine methyltransferase n=1 Tax=Tilletia horrida TaxID=155126 RepID=A0AAN6JSX9_9BASI|nr:AdoMet-homocysteine methyltransferase [Tilletia horrida]
MLRALDAILEEGIPIKPAYISFVFPSGSGLPFAEAGTSIENGDGMSALVSLLRPRQGWSLSGIGINCTKAKYIPALTKDLTLRLSELSKHHGSIEAVLFIEPDGGLVYDGATRTWSLADSDDSTTPASWEQNVLRGIPGYPARSETESPWAGVVVGGCCKATTDHIKRLIVAKAGLHPSS